METETGIPFRLSVMTLNVWNDERLDERATALQTLLRRHDPDILCVQELRPSVHDLITDALPAHRWVEDRFRGWQYEGNIYFRKAGLHLMTYGAEDIGMWEEYRRLFWVRLCVAGTDKALIVANAHFTWEGNPTEKQGGVSPRFRQALATVEALDRINRDGNPVLFMGDLNDHLHPIRLLREGGYVDSFTTLGYVHRPTWPTIPTLEGVPATLDWMMHRGSLTPCCSEVIELFEEGVAPSDHRPVLTVYSWR